MNASGIIYAAAAGVLLTLAALEGASREGARIIQGYEERAALVTLATRAGVPVPPEVYRVPLH